MINTYQCNHCYEEFEINFDRNYILCYDCRKGYLIKKYQTLNQTITM